MVTFRLTIPQFEQLLAVILRPEAPDHLTNLVLMACTRPRDGVIAVPVSLPDAKAICELVDAAANDEAVHVDFALLLDRQRTGDVP